MRKQRNKKKGESATDRQTEKQRTNTSQSAKRLQKLCTALSEHLYVHVLVHQAFAEWDPHPPNPSCLFVSGFSLTTELISLPEQFRQPTPEAGFSLSLPSNVLLQFQFVGIFNIFYVYTEETVFKNLK